MQCRRAIPMVILTLLVPVTNSVQIATLSPRGLAALGLNGSAGSALRERCAILRLGWESWGWADSTFVRAGLSGEKVVVAADGGARLVDNSIYLVVNKAESRPYPPPMCLGHATLTCTRNKEEEE